MAMWINWYPVFETGVNYAYTYKNTLNKPMVRVESEKLKNIFKCKEVIGEITLQVITNQTYYIKYDNNFLKTDYPQRLYLILIYDKTQCKTIKFKRGNLYIKINTEKGECESDDYTTISDELELINDVTSYGYANTDIGIKLPMSQFTLTEEFGIEYNLDPYVWTTETGESWTPNQLKFSSIVKYSNILTEDNIDSGDATLLPVTSSSANASSYEQDENGYCYIKDNEGNIVYNKLLNKIARKTKTNNGYRINRNQSLELLSFGNNIYDINQKTEGQFLFSGNKKQKYGLKKDDKVNSILQQNIPYFGGNPAIYPVVVYNNTNKMLFDDLSITKTSNKIIVNQKEYDLKEQDLLVAYIREHGEWIPKKSIGIDNSDSSIKYWSFQKGSVYTNHRIAILSSGTNSAELKFSRMKTYNIQDNITLTWNGQSIPSAFNEISLHDFFYTNIIVPENKTIQIPIKNVSDFSMFTTLTHYDSACSIGNYNYEKGYKNLSWNNHCNFSMAVTLKDFSTIQINPTKVNEYDIGTAAKEEQTTTGDIYAFTDAEGRGGLSRYYQHIAILQGNLKSAPGTFPLRCNYFNGDNKKTILSNTYGHEEYFETSDAYSVFPSLIKVNDKEYSYNYHYDNTEDTSSTLVDVDHLSLYLNFAYLNTTYKKYAIAIVIWKNGKLLENS